MALEFLQPSYTFAGEIGRNFTRPSIGGTGKEPGQFARPRGMAVDSKGCLYVADAGNQRIQKFEMPE